jgi:hypothetical protein
LPLLNEGSSIEASIPMMAMTTNNSISVNPVIAAFFPISCGSRFDFTFVMFDSNTIFQHHLLAWQGALVGE